ncbi:hypothetical protein L6R52_38425 [Myxococcota bacterium]|nr:hypothetical protein [Myxococcota bacterium]
MQTAELARPAEIAPVTQAPLQRVDADAREQTRPKLVEAAPASSVQSTGQSAQLRIRAQRPDGRSGGVRTKKLKTEHVGSMSRPARLAFHGVQEVLAQAKQLLASKPRSDAAQTTGDVDAPKAAE